MNVIDPEIVMDGNEMNDSIQVNDDGTVTMDQLMYLHSIKISFQSGLALGVITGLVGGWIVHKLIH